MTLSTPHDVPEETTATVTARDIFAVAWPLGLKAIMLHGIIVIDAYLVAPLGETALAAMGLAGALAGLMLGILFAFSSATQIRIAQAFGSSGDVALKTGFYSGLILNLFAAAAGIVFVVLFGDRIITSLAQTDWIAVQAKGYLAVMLFVVLSEAFGQCLSSHFNGCGKTRIPFLSYLVALPINIGASLILIYGYLGFPELGVVGAAYGTALAALTRAVLLGFFLWRTNYGFRDVEGWANGTLATSFRRHFNFSWPIAATFVSASAGNHVSMLISAKLDVNEFAALTLMMPWVQVAGTIGMGWAQATGIIAAQLLGKRATEPELDAFLRVAWKWAFIAAAIVAVTYLCICLASAWIYDDLQPETKTALFAFLPILLLLPFPKGSNAICGQTLRAAGDTVYVMNIFLSSQWLVKVPLTALFVLVLGLPVTWVFALLLLDEILKFPLFHRRLLSGRWKTATDVLR